MELSELYYNYIIKDPHVLVFRIHIFHTIIIFNSIFLFIYLSRLFISLMTIDPFCKSCVKTDMTSLHYVTFIELLTIFPTEALSFDSE
jgi:hypothetical protein